MSEFDVYSKGIDGLLNLVEVANIFMNSGGAPVGAGVGGGAVAALGQSASAGAAAGGSSKEVGQTSFLVYIEKVSVCIVALVQSASEVGNQKKLFAFLVSKLSEGARS